MCVCFSGIFQLVKRLYALPSALTHVTLISTSNLRGTGERGSERVRQCFVFAIHLVYWLQILWRTYLFGFDILVDALIASHIQMRFLYVVFLARCFICLAVCISLAHASLFLHANPSCITKQTNIFIISFVECHSTLCIFFPLSRLVLFHLCPFPFAFFILSGNLHEKKAANLSHTTSKK